jgi:hypothetical protein
MKNIFFEKLSAIFEGEGGGENIISAKDMQDLVDAGTATSKIDSEWGQLENSSHLRQVGEFLYKRVENPYSLNFGKGPDENEEDDTYFWQLWNQTGRRSDASSGNGAGG